MCLEAEATQPFASVTVTLTSYPVVLFAVFPVKVTLLCVVSDKLFARVEVHAQVLVASIETLKLAVSLRQVRFLLAVI